MMFNSGAKVQNIEEMMSKDVKKKNLDDKVSNFEGKTKDNKSSKSNEKKEEIKSEKKNEKKSK